MSETLVNIILWLFVINLGIAFGAGLYESRIVVPQWLSYSPESGYRWNSDAARRANVGLRFWVYVTTVPLTLLTLASLVVAWWTSEIIRVWWLSTLVHKYGNQNLSRLPIHAASGIFSRSLVRSSRVNFH